MVIFILIVKRNERRNSKGKIFFNFFFFFSKLANLLFAIELSRKLKNDKIGITVNAIHPGIIKTDLFRNTDALSSAGIDLLGVFLWKSIEQGAATTIYVATAPELKGKTGEFFNDCEIEETREDLINEENSKKLWEITEKETKIKYPF